MSEEKQTQGKIDGFEIAKRKDGSEIKGTKKDVTPYTAYKYKIGGRFFSDFKTPEEYKVKIGEYVIVTYTETENPGKAPYKNVKNIVQAVAPDEVKEANKQYNVKPVGDPPPQSYEDNQIKGMVFKKTIDWIIATRRLALEGKLRDKENKLIAAKDYPLEYNFDTVFDFLLKKIKK